MIAKLFNSFFMQYFSPSSKQLFANPFSDFIYQSALKFSQSSTIPFFSLIVILIVIVCNFALCCNQPKEVFSRWRELTLYGLISIEQTHMQIIIKHFFSFRSLINSLPIMYRNEQPPFLPDDISVIIQIFYQTAFFHVSIYQSFGENYFC